jgi:hypothetical protein
MSVSKFFVRDLFGKYDIELDLDKKYQVVIGPNGTGKSTALKLLHLFSSGSYPDMIQYPFDYIELYDGDAIAPASYYYDDFFPEENDLIELYDALVEQKRIEKYGEEYTESDKYASLGRIEAASATGKYGNDMIMELKEKGLLYDYLRNCYCRHPQTDAINQVVYKYRFEATGTFELIVDPDEIIRSIMYATDDGESAGPGAKRPLCRIEKLGLIVPEFDNILYLNQVTDYTIPDAFKKCITDYSDSDWILREIGKDFITKDLCRDVLNINALIAVEYYNQSGLYLILDYLDHDVYAEAMAKVPEEYRKHLSELRIYETPLDKLHEIINSTIRKDYTEKKIIEQDMKEFENFEYPNDPDACNEYELYEDRQIPVDPADGDYFSNAPNAVHDEDDEFLMQTAMNRFKPDDDDDSWMEEFSPDEDKWGSDPVREVEIKSGGSDTLSLADIYLPTALPEEFREALDFQPIISDEYWSEKNKAYAWLYNNICKNLLTNFVKELKKKTYVNRKIRKLEKLINEYLYDKEVEILPIGIFVKKKDPSGAKRLININNMSSGEKKLVCLLTIAALCEGSTLLLDEPEVSLSLVWQQNILPDMLSFDSVRAVIAATQSPYIVDKFEDADDNIVMLPQNRKNGETDE